MMGQLQNSPVRDRHLARTRMSVTLIIALAALLSWALVLLLTSVTTGVIHLLLALGATLLVRWWALRE